MTGISRYEKVILLLTAGFFLFVGGWFFARQSETAPYQVTTLQSAEQPEERSEDSGEGNKPDSLLEGETININTAHPKDLERLPGIGEKRAGDIVAYREANGPFEQVEDIQRVSGIGEATFEGLRQYICVRD